jgi:predicted AAA+ superfamily ATPase
MGSNLINIDLKWMYMPHSRLRFAKNWVQKLASFWPAVGVTGLRQVGKTTLLREQIGIPNYFSLDDEDTRILAESSSKVFLAQTALPVIIDEVQKVPKIFDALKSTIDRNKRPGQYFLTGSSQFSAKLGIRESLTGRIGLMQLFPMTLREMTPSPFGKGFRTPIHQEKLQFRTEDVASAMSRGGLPVPAFIRDSGAVDMYWKSWLDTLVYRDVGRVYGKGYDPEIAMNIFRKIGKILHSGDSVIAAELGSNMRRLRPYLEAMEAVFLLRRFCCDDRGVGKDRWLLGDSGLAQYLIGSLPSTGSSLSLARHFILNEIVAQNEYEGKSLPLQYFKSAKGSIVDFVWNGIPIKISETYSSSLGWQERAIAGAMKKLKSKLGILVAPTDHVILPKNLEGIAVVPWSYWS